MKGNNIIYFDSFGVKHIPNKIKKFIADKNIINNVYKIEVCNSIMCGYFCIGFSDFLIKGGSFKIIQIYFLLTNMKRMTK